MRFKHFEACMQLRTILFAAAYFSGPTWPQAFASPTPPFENLDVYTMATSLPYISDIAVCPTKGELVFFTWDTMVGPYSLQRLKLFDQAFPTDMLLRASPGSQDGRASDGPQFNGPMGVDCSPDETWLVVADTANNRLRRVDLSSGATTTLAGDSDPGAQDGSTPRMG